MFAFNVDNSILNSANGVILDCIVADDHGAGVETAGNKTVANFSNMALKGDITIRAPASVKKAQDGKMYMVGGDLLVNLENVAMSGAITTSTHKDWFALNGVDNSMMSPFDPTNAKYAQYIGLGTDTYGAPDNDGDGKVDAYGLKVTLDATVEVDCDQDVVPDRSHLRERRHPGSEGLPAEHDGQRRTGSDAGWKLHRLHRARADPGRRVRRHFTRAAPATRDQLDRGQRDTRHRPLPGTGDHRALVQRPGRNALVQRPREGSWRRIAPAISRPSSATTIRL